MGKLKNIFIASIIILSLGLSANAATEAELKSQILEIQTLIAQLQQQLALLTQGWCHNFNTNLKIGDFSSEVSSLRYALSKEKIIFMLSDIDANNFFDSEMRSAVSKFQEVYASEILYPLGLAKATGFAGPSTRSKLNKLYGCRPVITEQENLDTALSITSISGPSAIKANESGTWTINVNNPKQEQLSYSALWGDEGFFQSYFDIKQAYANSPVFTHSFSAPGNYSATFYVKNNEGTIITQSFDIGVSPNI